MANISLLIDLGSISVASQHGRRVTSSYLCLHLFFVSYLCPTPFTDMFQYVAIDIWNASS